MNLDKLQRYPNQNTEKRFDECTGETWADILGNIYNQPFDAGYAYACARRISNIKPDVVGVDAYSGGLGAVVYGAMPTDKVPFDINTATESYEADVNNYDAPSRLTALSYPLNGLRSLETYEDVANYLLTGKTGVQLTMKWHQNFGAPNFDGSLSNPIGVFTYHCVAAYEVTDKGLRIKPWLGSDYGEGGYCFLPREVFDQVVLSASAPVLEASRWASLVSTLISRWYLFADIFPQLSGKTPDFAGGTIQAMATLENLALAIRDYEGSPGDANYINHNPGNCRCSPDGYLPKYEPVHCSPAGFAVFRDYATGWLYLCNLLRNRIENHPNWTLLQFMENYAPTGDKNDPTAYAAYVAKRLGVDINYKVKNLIV